MLEPWEKILLLSIFGTLFVLVLIGIFKYMPQHLLIMQQRATYYLWGEEGQWFRLGRQGSIVQGGLGSQKEL